MHIKKLEDGTWKLISSEVAPREVDDGHDVDYAEQGYTEPID